MTTPTHGSGSPRAEGPSRPDEAANDHFPVKARWQPTAEAIKTWEITLAMEKCALWHYYRIS